MSQPSHPVAPGGTLVLVVGASGVGKDTVIDGLRAAFAGDERIAFARRTITRPGNAGGEAHVPASTAEFDSLAESGAFLLHWNANGQHYGIPRSVAEDLARGRHVIANVSRTVLGTARALGYPMLVLWITVSPAVLEKRLLARGRESAADIAGRLARARLAEPAGPDVIVIRNDGPPGEAIANAVQALSRELSIA